MEEYGHIPVLRETCIRELRIRPDGNYADGTLGRAGHAEAIAERLTEGHLYGIDRDGDAIAAAKKRLAPYGEHVTLIHGNFAEIGKLLCSVSAPPLDGMLFDLGVSSPQLDDAERGFSYMNDAPLDMRMDRTEMLTAADVVNEYSEQELLRILRDYGEERYAASIARNIVHSRTVGRIETTGELCEIIRKSMPAGALREKQHPAKRTFQAIRIEVNGELAAVKAMIPEAIRALKSGGRLLIITFHSLEDRIVKEAMNELSSGCTCPPDLPVCVCGKKPIIRKVTKKPLLPTEKEIENNPRARSAHLRICEKI